MKKRKERVKKKKERWMQGRKEKVALNVVYMHQNTASFPLELKTNEQNKTLFHSHQCIVLCLELP